MDPRALHVQPVGEEQRCEAGEQPRSLSVFFPAYNEAAKRSIEEFLA